MPPPLSLQGNSARGRMAGQERLLWFRILCFFTGLWNLFYCVECLCTLKESEALLQLKPANSPFDLIDLSSWKNGTDCCRGWAGVACDASGQHVIELNITTGLTGTDVSEALCNLRKLQVLNLGFDTLREGVRAPDCLWEMPELRYLELVSDSASQQFWSQVCNLANIAHLGLEQTYQKQYASIPECIWRMARLEYLRLTGFASPSSLSRDVCNLANLKYIHLEDVYLYGDIPTCIWNLTKLEHLSYSGALTLPLAVGAFFSSDICNLKSLSYLSMNSVSFARGYIPACLWSITGLEVLQIGSLNLPGSFSSQMCNLPKLQILDISYNKFAGAPPACIWNLTRLENVDLSALDLSDMKTPPELSVPSLSRLVIASTNVNEAFLDKVGNLSALSTLDISGNSITTLPIGFGKLSRLTSLDASNNLMTTIPGSLGGLQNLNFLVISYNAIRTLRTFRSPVQNPHGSGDLSVLSNLTGLLELHLSNNFIADIPPSMFNSSPMFSLDLSDNLLERIPWPASPLINLDYLRLSNNPVREISDGLCHQRLTYLFLSNTSLGFSDMGVKPLCLNNMSHLTWLDLSSNRISGNFSAVTSSTVYNLTQMQCLDFSNNNISGDLSSLSGFHPNLQILDLSRNQLSGAIPKSLLLSAPWIFGSKWMNLSRNQLSGHIPELHGNEWNLDLSWNQFGGPFPPISASTFTSLVLSRNNLTGSIPSGLKNSKSLSVLDLSSNNLSGTIPSFLGGINSLQVLDLSSNRFEGSLPEELRGCKVLQHLRLNNNILRGQIPSSIGEVGNSLLSLTVSNNDLEGPVPSSLSNCRSLKLLDLSHNNLNGTLPSTFGNLSGSLRVFTVGSNRLQGPFPAWIVNGNFTYLQVLDLSNNSFHGDLPAAYSKLSGFINGTGGAGNNDTLYADGVEISAKGQQLVITYFVSVRTSLDVSSNQFSGSIPEKLGDLEALRYLTLSGNRITGQIPTELSNLNKLESLDLSRNSLTGSIPPELSEIPQLSYFNVSDNFLTGAIPQGRQFDTFPASSFRNNTNLCSVSGIPLPPCRMPQGGAPTSGSQNGHHRHSWRQGLSRWVSREFLYAFLVGCGIGYVTVGSLFMVSRKARNLLFVPRRKARVVLDYSRPYGAFMPKT